MSRSETKRTSTAGSATVFGQREMLSGESRMNSLVSASGHNGSKKINESNVGHAATKRTGTLQKS